LRILFYGLWLMAYSAEFRVYGLWFRGFDLEYMIYGFGCIGSWFLTRGLCFMLHFSWSPINSLRLVVYDSW
jgi:hypothetical protein